MQVQYLGRYRVVKELGRGAMGRVYLAHDPEIDRPVAIKAIQVFSALPQADQAAARERFLREARSAGKLLHPGIVTIFDVGEAEGVPYLAMEYVEGQTLDTFCRRDDLLPVGTVVEIAARVAEALAYAHKSGIVHRDVKPANLMRLGETSVKIMDFGLAKNPQTQLTQDGTLMGTPAYMSPEQVRGDPLDGRSDLFSLGVVLYEMLTGEKPFGGESVSSVLYRIVNEDAPEAFTQRPSLPNSLSEFLRQALAKKPEERFGDGEAFAAALRQAGAGTFAAAPPEAAVPGPAKAVAERARPKAAATAGPATGAPEAGRRSKGKIAGILGGVLVLAAVAAGAYVVIRGLPGTPSESAVVMLDARVRTEPAGIPLRLDGKPFAADSVRFPVSGPFGLLTAEQDCRTASHTLAPEDGGREVVLVLDPVSAEVVADPGVTGARVRLNGAEALAAPARMVLELCRDNVLEATAKGFRATRITISKGATPLEARTAAAGLRLAAIPTGRLKLPETRFPVTFLVDGRRVQKGSGTIELPEGKHELRAADEERWIDVRADVEVAGGETVTPRLEIPGMAELVVQAFPGNCKVYLRREGTDWRFLDDAPMERELAAGKYRVKVVYEPTGESKEQDVELVAGSNNPPLRFGFERGGRR